MNTLLAETPQETWDSLCPSAVEKIQHLNLQPELGILVPDSLENLPYDYIGGLADVLSLGIQRNRPSANARRKIGMPDNIWYYNPYLAFSDTRALVCLALQNWFGGNTRIIHKQTVGPQHRWKVGRTELVYDALHPLSEHSVVRPDLYQELLDFCEAKLQRLELLGRFAPADREEEQKAWEIFKQQKISGDKDPIRTPSIAYWASLLDFTGGITIQRTPNYAACVNLTFTNLPLAYYTYMKFGGHMCVETKGTDAKRETYGWIVKGLPALTFLREIYPYLIFRRPLADIAIEFQHTETDMNKLDKANLPRDRFGQIKTPSQFELERREKIRKHYFDIMYQMRKQLGERIMND